MVAFLLLMSFLGTVTPSAAETKKAAGERTQTVQSRKPPQKTAEELYLDGLACFKTEDVGCVGVTLAAINPSSPYAKLLRAQMAMANDDSDTPLRILIPLQAEAGLLPQAYASLHATLALAYEAQGNVLEAMQQHVKCEPFLSAEEVADRQGRLWKLLSMQSRDVLVEMRGESPDPVVQGWIDLALAATYADRKTRNIEQWRLAYPDHPAGDDFLASISEAAMTKEIPRKETVFQGQVALLLPLETPAYRGAAQAVQDGFMAARAAGSGQSDVVVYATGDAEATRMAYRHAVEGGAQWVVGPLTRDEVAALVVQPLEVPTLTLNQPEGEFKPQQNLMMFGLSADAEARQVARDAHSQGLQSAMVVIGDGMLSQRIGKAFMEEWQSLEGKISRQLAIPAVEKLAEFKVETAGLSSDMIFLAAGYVQARMVRPYLDAAVPTYGTSHLYDGIPGSLQNLDLVAVHFVDMPWLVAPEKSEFIGAGRKGPAELQRLFALGWDAYALLPLLSEHPAAGKRLLEGATGDISVAAGGVLQRELPMAQFRSDGVALEAQP